MEDFFKQFQKQLEKRPAPSFEERDWQTLQQRLTQFHQKQSATFGWGWLALPLLLLLAGTNAWWYYRTETTQPARQGIQPDTVFQTQVLYQTDTVYVTRMVSAPGISMPGIDSAIPKVSLRNQPPRSLLSDLPPTPFQPVGGQERQTAEAASQETKKQPIDKLSVVWLPPWDIQLPPVRQIREDIVFPKRNKAFLTRILPLRLYDFQVGIAGGWAYWPGQYRSYGPMVGVRAAVGFSPHLRLWTETSYLNTHLQVSEFDETIGIPAIAPPVDAFVFLKAEAPQPMLQYAIGLHYQFNLQSRLMPFAGIGYGLLKSLPYEIIYEFSNPVTGLEWQYEQQGEVQPLQPGFLLLQAGFDYPLGQHWYGQVQATHRTRWTKTSDRLFGIQGGLQYRF